MRLSRRLPGDLSDSPFFKELSSLKRDAGAYADLTLSSPIRAGIPFDLPRAIESAKSGFGDWNPDSAGAECAREAVAGYYAIRGCPWDVEKLLLTASTSEAYSILFKTLCDPGDVVLTPLPGYPLLDTLASLELLKTAPYFLELSDGKWNLDEDSLYAFPRNTKILLIVSPNNPTGHVISKEEWAAAVRFASMNELSIVVDEVFGDYIYDGTERPWNWDSSDVPVFFLNGLSKVAGSPEIKLGWIAYREGRLGDSLKRSLEYVADAYLSVSSSAFSLARPMIAASADYEKKIGLRIEENLATLRQTFPSAEIFPNVQGGWYAAIHFEGADDERVTFDLLRKEQVLVQPGFFFDFDDDGWIVIGLLPDPALFTDAIRRIHLLSAT